MKNTNPIFAAILIGLLLTFFYWLLPGGNREFEPAAVAANAESPEVAEELSVTASAEAETAKMETGGVFRSEINDSDTILKNGGALRLTITLRNVAGDLLSSGLVFLETEDVPLNKSSEWIKPSENGRFHLPLPSTSIWIHAYAPGYWSKVIAWNSEDSQSQTVELDAITTFQEIQCLDFLTQQPVAGVLFHSFNNRSDRVLRWRGSVVSDSQGVVHFPRFDEGYFSVQILGGDEQGLIASRFEISQFTETIPMFRRCEVTLTVQDEEGLVLGSSPVGADGFHLYNEQTPRANMDLPYQRATCDQHGQAKLQLAIGLEQTVWVNHPEYGLHKQIITPSAAVEEIAFSLPKSAPLVIAIDLPSGVDQELLTAMLRFRGSRKTEPLLRGEDGLFTLAVPSSIRQITFNAPGCQSLLGYLWNPPPNSAGSVDQTAGFVRFAMQRGFDVAGKALHTDGSPAQVACYLWEAEVDTPTPKPSERTDADAWTWMLAPPHAPLDTKPDGSFLFRGMPEGTYILDVMFDGNQQGVFTALCTYVSEKDMIRVPQAEPVTVILPRLEDCEVRVFDAITQEPLKRFDLSRKTKQNGMFGLPGDSSSGLLRGLLPVDELDDILVKVDGYIYAELQRAQIDSSQTPWQLRVALQPITPGSLTALFDLPAPESDAPQAITADASTVLIGVSIDAPRWSEFYDLRSGEAQSLAVPVGSSTVLGIYVRDHKLRDRFRVEPKSVTYQPGQNITVTLVPLDSDEG